MRHKLPEIDVIITVYKPDKKFRYLLMGLHSQTLPPSRIILLNTGKMHWRREWIKGIPEAEVHHVREHEYDHGGTRCMGAELSTAPYMIFMTQDAVPADERLLSRLYHAMEDTQVAVAYARQLPSPGSNPVDAYIRNYNYPKESRKKIKKDIETLGIKAFFCSDVCAIYRKTDYLMLGGFPRRAIFNEDMIFAKKALDSGKAVYYAADARVYHSHNYTGMQQLRRTFDLAVSQKQNPQTFANISSETEGARMVKKTAVYLIKTRRWYLLPSLLISSIAKYTGYLLGSHYDRMPEQMLMYFTSNKNFWWRERE